MQLFRYCRIFAIFLLFFQFHPLFCAEITVPRMELATWGAEIDGNFAFATNAAIDINLSGGYKYGFLLGLSFITANLGKALAYRNFAIAPAAGVTVSPEEYNNLVDRYNNQAVLSFRIAKATARDLFNLPLEFSYFAGLGDPLCSGEEFASRYGIYDVGTAFTGFYYFPEGIGRNPQRRYNGLYSVQGTGFSFALTKLENFIPMLYLYQDFTIFDGRELLFERPQFSGDLRFLFNLMHFQAEAYTGISGAKGEKPEIRGGILAFFRSGAGTEFLLQCGIPGWKIDEEFSIDNLYLLFEPRLRFGIVALHTTFFYHPIKYLHIITEEERGKADINIKLLIGDLPRFNIVGGFETTMGLQVYGMADYSMTMGPFISILGSGLQWDVKLRIDPLAWQTPGQVFQFFAGVKTAF